MIRTSISPLAGRSRAGLGLLVLVLVAAVMGAARASAELVVLAQQELVPISGTLSSGYGEIGDQDQFNEFLVEGGDWQPAWIVTPHPLYSSVPNTKWIGAAANGSGPSETHYRICFVLPHTFEEPDLDVLVHADDAAVVSLNGEPFGAQLHQPNPPNFQNPPEAFSTAAPFLEGRNELRIVVTDYGNPTGLNYEATVTFLGAANQPDVEPVRCGAALGSISLEPLEAQEELGAQHSVTATVRGDDGTLLVGKTVDFVVTSGPNAETNGQPSTDSQGQATFSYVGDGGTGTDTIEASFTDASGAVRGTSATVTWVAVNPSNVYVDDDWADTSQGVDPDGPGPATSFGVDAFATVDDAVDAVDDAPPGSTVHVAAGTYDDEGVIDVQQDGIQLIGAGSFQTHVHLDRLDVEEPNVVVDGFDLIGPGTWTLEGCNDCDRPVVRVGGDDVFNVIIRNNSISGGKRGIAFAGEEDGVATHDSEASNNVLFHNIAGVAVDSGSNNRILGNEIRDNGDPSDSPQASVLIMDNHTECPTGNVVAGNTIANSGNHGISVRSSGTIVANNEISNSGTTYPAFRSSSGIEIVDQNCEPLEGTVISNNRITNSAFAGIKLGDGVDGTFIINNTIVGTKHGGAEGPDESNSGGSAILLTHFGATDTTIASNALVANTGHGIFVADSDGQSNGTVAHNNDISGNGLSGVTNAGGNLVDATSNWWGAADGPSGVGPGGGDAVTENVTFDPWLTTNPCASGGCSQAVFVTKTADATTSAPGAENGYTITVWNQHEEAVTVTPIVDMLPAGFDYVAQSTTGVTTSEPLVDEGSLRWNGNFVVPGGQSVSLHFRVEVASTPGLYWNEATAEAPGHFVVPSGPTAGITVEEAASADVFIAVAGSPQEVEVGSELLYTLDVGNGGPNSAPDAFLTDVLPAGLEFLRASAPEGCSFDNELRRITCPLGTLEPAEEMSIDLVVRVLQAGTFTTNGAIAADAPDPNPLNNRVAGTVIGTGVEPPDEEEPGDAAADLSLAVTENADPIMDGDTARYTLSVANSGPDAAEGTTLTTTVAGGPVTTTPSASQGSCSVNGATVTCQLGTVPVQGGANVVIDLVPAGPGSVGISSQVTSSAGDPNTQNNGAAASTTVKRPLLSIDDVAAVEGTGAATSVLFTVRLLEPARKTVTVDFATGDGTAVAVADYAPASGTLTFAPGQLAQSVTLNLNGDTTDEHEETARVVLSNAKNAGIQHGVGTATIKNDDLPPTVSVIGVTVVEGNPTTFAAATQGETFAIFILGLSEASGKVVTVDFATADGTARGGTDYTPTSGTATFQPGETRRAVAVPVTPNSNDEVDRSFSLQLGSASNATVQQGGSEAQGTIQDDDEPPPPVAGESGNGSVKTGEILIKLPGTDVFIPLTGPVQLPIGTIVDATKGVLNLQMSDGAGGTYTGEFSAGIFTILEQTRGVVRVLGGSQAKKPKAKKPKKKKTVTLLFTTLELAGGDFGICTQPRRLAGSAQEKPKPKAVRRLWGNSKGKFRTKGRHSAATVRGTRWLTSDRCDGTLTYVAQGGPVSVLDFRTRKTIELKQGQTYVAKVRGRR